MLLGDYKRIDWKAYESPRADIHFRDNFDSFYDHKTCGSAAIRILTGLSSIYIDESLPGNRLHWTDTSICRFLKSAGYTVLPVTKFGVTFEYYRTFEKIRPMIRLNHVILSSQLVCKDEASWFVVHKNAVWHDMRRSRLNPLHFVYFPIQSIFVVWHPEWA